MLNSVLDLSTMDFCCWGSFKRDDVCLTSPGTLSALILFTFAWFLPCVSVTGSYCSWTLLALVSCSAMPFALLHGWIFSVLVSWRFGLVLKLNILVT